LYECATQPLTLKEEHTLMIFKKRATSKIFGAKRDEVTGERK
jgi:hypothetical protein